MFTIDVSFVTQACGFVMGVYTISIALAVFAMLGAMGVWAFTTDADRCERYAEYAYVASACAYVAHVMGCVASFTLLCVPIDNTEVWTARIETARGPLTTIVMVDGHVCYIVARYVPMENELLRQKRDDYFKSSYERSFFYLSTAVFTVATPLVCFGIFSATDSVAESHNPCPSAA